MFSGSSDLPQNSLLIKQDDKFFSRLLTKESSLANPSVRVYYGGLPGAIPFLWESQPGTPKHPLSENFTPPLTPPPSYHSKFNKNPTKKQSRSNRLHTLFLKLGLNKINMLSPSPPSSSSNSSLSWSSSSNFGTTRYQWSHFSSGSLSSDSKEDEEAMGISSPTSTLCFGFSSARLRSCCRS